MGRPACAVRPSLGAVTCASHRKALSAGAVCASSLLAGAAQRRRGWCRAGNCRARWLTTVSSLSAAGFQEMRPAMAPRSTARATDPQADHAVPPGAATRSDVLCPGRRRCRRRPAAVRQGRVRRLSRMRHPGLRVPAPALRGLRPRPAAGLQLQGPRLSSSCGAGRMSQTAAHLVDHVIPQVTVQATRRPGPLRSAASEWLGDLRKRPEGKG